VQFWSLSLEEQFYLVVGFAAVWVLVAKRRVQVLSAVMVALVAWISWSRWNVDLGPWPGKEYSLDPWTRDRLARDIATAVLPRLHHQPPA